MLIEVCRVLDYLDVVQTFSENRDNKLPAPEGRMLGRTLINRLDKNQ
jgi:hypothetical protein